MQKDGHPMSGVVERLLKIKDKEVVGEAGAGAVRVIIVFPMQVKRIEIDSNLLSVLCDGGEDKVVAEELIAAAVNDATNKHQDLVSRAASGA